MSVYFNLKKKSTFFPRQIQKSQNMYQKQKKLESDNNGMHKGYLYDKVYKKEESNITRSIMTPLQMSII